MISKLQRVIDQHDEMADRDGDNAHTQYILASGSRGGATGSVQRLDRGIAIGDGYAIAWDTDPGYNPGQVIIGTQGILGRTDLQISAQCPSDAGLEGLIGVTYQDRAGESIGYTLNNNGVVFSRTGSTKTISAGGMKITTMADGVAANDAASYGQLTTHEGAADPHTQYLLADGTRPGGTGQEQRFEDGINLGATGAIRIYHNGSWNIVNSTGHAYIRNTVATASMNYRTGRDFIFASEAGAFRAVIYRNGEFGANIVSPTAMFHAVATGTTKRGMIIKGANGQSVNLIEGRDDSDNVLNFWGPTGGATLGDYNAGDYVEIDNTGDMVFVGGGGLAYAGISVVSNSTEITIADADTFYQITDFDTNDPSNNCTPDHTNDHITIAKTGDYWVQIIATINSLAGIGSRLEMVAQKNNGATELAPVHVDQDMAGGGSESHSVVAGGLVALAAGDTLEAWIKNETGDQNYVIEDITLSVWQLGG